ncbi:hypothetical protein HII31_12955 [Pseudocercospora fuligena]|uniref:F-box domain-containing protein n=1 Tax=Pseudocercospora fuligena TaxID=685502 RepID=A0A8H6R5Y2_9PEZI|nr:hypothetical protein HII31_12955 [Pseudocercospora fuligena]
MPIAECIEELAARVEQQLYLRRETDLLPSSVHKLSEGQDAELRDSISIHREATDSNTTDTIFSTPPLNETKLPTDEVESQPAATGVNATAVARVLSTVELAEGIFCHLDMEDLLRVRCVSMKLHDLILSSPRLRRALFLDPGSLADVHQDDRRLITQLISSAYTRDTWMQKLVANPSAYLPESLIEDFDPSQVTFNPFFVKCCINDCSPLTQRRLPQITTKYLYTNPDFFFRKMYITQPPLPIKTSTIEIDSKACMTHCKDRMLEEHFDLDWKPTHEALGKGMKLGELVDVLHERVSSVCPYSKARVDSLSGFGMTFELAVAESETKTEHEVGEIQQGGNVQGGTEEEPEDRKPFCVPRGPDNSPVEAGYARLLALENEDQSEESEDETYNL